MSSCKHNKIVAKSENREGSVELMGSRIVRPTGKDVDFGR
jgi:hypothetical protein